jgi:hypothetical protein
MRFHEIISERAVDDAKAATAAQKAYRSFAEYAVSNEECDIVLDMDGSEFYGFYPKNFRNGEIFGPDDMIVMVGPKTSSNVTASLNTFDEPVEGKYQYALVMRSARADSEESAVDSISSTQFLTAFKHEMIHRFDNIRTNGKVTANDPNYNSKDHRVYFNDVFEFNAFYHEIASDLTSALHEISDYPGDASEIADLYGYDPDFKTYLKKITQSGDGKLFVRELTTDRRKALLRRLYKMHDEVKNQIAAAASTKH